MRGFYASHGLSKLNSGDTGLWVRLVRAYTFCRMDVPTWENSRRLSLSSRRARWNLLLAFSFYT
jgi:hypothetical protein